MSFDAIRGVRRGGFRAFNSSKMNGHNIEDGMHCLLSSAAMVHRNKVVIVDRALNSIYTEIIL